MFVSHNDSFVRQLKNIRGNMLSKYQDQINTLKNNNPSFKALCDQYESAESEKLRQELEIRIIEILEKAK